MKLFPISSVLIGCAVWLGFAAQTARAQEDTGTYLRIDGGINFASDLSLDSAQLGLNGSKLSLNTGYRVDAAVGYDLNRWVGLELQGGFFHNGAESLTLQSYPVKVDDSWLQGVPLLVDVRVHYPNRSNFVPYVGGGAGGIISMLSINDNTDTTAVFAFEVCAGVIYKIDERAWIDVSYKYLYAGDTDYEIGLSQITASKIRCQFIGASVIWRF